MSVKDNFQESDLIITDIHTTTDEDTISYENYYMKSGYPYIYNENLVHSQLQPATIKKIQNRMKIYTFMDLVHTFKDPIREIDLWIEYWHERKEETNAKQKLHEYLGMTEHEYAKFVEDPNALIDIIKDRNLHAALNKIDDVFITGNFEKDNIENVGEEFFIKSGIVPSIWPQKIIVSKLFEKDGYFYIETENE